MNYMNSKFRLVGIIIALCILVGIINRFIPEQEIETQDQTKAHHSECFMLSCMDFRLIDDMEKAMDKMGYNNNYDEFILAGGSLGLTQDKFKYWGQTALDHMDIGKKLHEFREILIFDHMDCGAYKKFYPDMKSPEEENKLHRENLQKAYSRLSQKFLNMTFKAMLMNIDGTYEEISIDKNDQSFDEFHKLDEEQADFLAQKLS